MQFIHSFRHLVSFHFAFYFPFVLCLFALPFLPFAFLFYFIFAFLFVFPRRRRQDFEQAGTGTGTGQVGPPPPFFILPLPCMETLYCLPLYLSSPILDQSLSSLFIFTFPTLRKGGKPRAPALLFACLPHAFVPCLPRFDPCPHFSTTKQLFYCTFGLVGPVTFLLPATYARG